MSPSLRIYPGERYYDLHTKDTFTILDIDRRGKRVLVETESGVEELRSFNSLVKALRSGRLIILDVKRQPNPEDEED